MNKFVYFLLASLLLSSCSSDIIKSEYRSLDNGVWDKDEVLEFSFSEVNPDLKHDLVINVRNDNSFGFSNLFLIAALTNPEGLVVKDTLEYTMSLPDGTWLGKGSGSIKENRLWYKENIRFSTPGVYKIEISHAMRKNGNVSGIVGLEGITDVGVELKLSNP